METARVNALNKKHEGNTQLFDNSQQDAVSHVHLEVNVFIQKRFREWLSCSHACSVSLFCTETQ